MRGISRRALATSPLLLVFLLLAAELDASWRYLGPRVPPRFWCCFLEVTVHPLDPDWLVGSGRNFRAPAESRDGGRSWNILDTSPKFFSTVLVSAADPREWYQFGDAGVEFSEDGGRTWNRSQPPITSSIGLVTVSPTTPGLAYAKPSQLGVLLRTRDGGRTWTREVRSELLTELLALSGDVLLARIHPSTLERSDDGGRTWRQVLEAVVAVAAQPGRPDHLEAIQVPDLNAGEGPPSLLVSEDSGRTWGSSASLPFTPEYSPRLVLDRDGGAFVIARDRSLWKRSPASGWQEVLPGAFAHGSSVTVAPSDPDRVYLLDGNRLLRSSDGGSTFEPTSPPELHWDSSVVPAGSDGSTLTTGRYTSEDDGETWFEDPAWPDGTESVLVRVGETILATTPSWGSFDQPSLLRSDDGGKSWSASGPGDGLSLLAPSTEGATLVLHRSASRFEAALFRSDDSGRTWNEVSRSSDAPLHGGSFLSLDARVDSEDALTAVGVFLVPDVQGAPGFGGLLWLEEGEGWQEVPLPARAGRLFTGARFAADGSLLLWGPGLFRSWDRGESWQTIIPSRVGDLELDPARPSRAFFTTRQGVLVTVDDFATWFPLGLTSGVEDLSLDRESGRLFARAPSGLHEWVFEGTEGCAAEGALCLAERFHVTATWQSTAATGTATPIELTADTGAFWFFDSDNVELVVKVLDGCAVNDHHWVFATGLTDVDVVLEVVETGTGRSRSWRSPLGTAFVPILDVEAFACSDSSTSRGEQDLYAIGSGAAEAR